MIFFSGRWVVKNPPKLIEGYKRNLPFYLPFWELTNALSSLAFLSRWFSIFCNQVGYVIRSLGFFETHVVSLETWTAGAPKLLRLKRNIIFQISYFGGSFFVSFRERNGCSFPAGLCRLPWHVGSFSTFTPGRCDHHPFDDARGEALTLTGLTCSQDKPNFYPPGNWELTYPPKMGFWRWFSFSQGGIC